MYYWAQIRFLAMERRLAILPRASGVGNRYLLESGSELHLFARSAEGKFGCSFLSPGESEVREVLIYAWGGEEVVAGTRLRISCSLDPLAIDGCGEVVQVFAHWNSACEEPAELQSPEVRFLGIG